MVDTIMNVTRKKTCCMPHYLCLVGTTNKSNMNRVTPQVANQISMDQKMARQPPFTQMPSESIVLQWL